MLLQTSETRPLIQAALAARLLAGPRPYFSLLGAPNPNAHEYDESDYNYGGSDDLLGASNPDAYGPDDEEFEEYPTGAPHQNEIHIDLLPTQHGQMGRYNLDSLAGPMGGQMLASPAMHGQFSNMYEPHFFRSAQGIIPPMGLPQIPMEWPQMPMGMQQMPMGMQQMPMGMQQMQFGMPIVMGNPIAMLQEPMPIAPAVPFPLAGMIPAPIFNPIAQPNHEVNPTQRNHGNNEDEPIVGAANPHDSVS